MIDWLLQGDPAIRWQTQRDLLAAPKSKWRAEQQQVATSGWGERLLAKQDKKGTWGGGIYTPKWTSTTYTLLQLHDLGLPRDNDAAKLGTRLVLQDLLGEPNTSRFSERLAQIDLCILGMCMELASYFCVTDARIPSMLQELLAREMADGGWNCRDHQRGVHHSSFNTTFNVLDGLRTYLDAGQKKFRPEILAAEKRALELVLQHHLFRSDKTNNIIKTRFVELSYPFYWHYDILRALDYLQGINAPRDERAAEAIARVRAKQDKDGTWSAHAPYTGKVFFKMEKLGAPSRWNTLRALCVLKWWGEK